MSNLIVVLRGLAFCHPAATATETRVLFPHAPKHDLKISVNGLPMWDNLEGSFISLSLQNGAVPVAASPPDNFLINMPYWHKRAGANLKLKPRHTTNMPITYLSLPSPAIYSGNLTEEKYEVWAHRSKSGSTPLRDYLEKPVTEYLAQDVFVRFNIPPAAQVVLNIDNVNPAAYTFTNQFGATHILLLDNHCHVPTCGSDFGYYYEMLESTDAAGMNVELNEFPIRPAYEVDPNTEAACNAVFGYPKGDLLTWYNGGATDPDVCETPGGC